MVTYADTAPQPGAGGLTDAQWQALATTWGDGIVGDNRMPGVGSGDGNSSWVITPSASDRTVNVFRLCPYRVRGYTFLPSQTNVTLPALPAPAAGQQQAHLIVARRTFATRTVSIEVVSGAAQSSTPGRPGLNRNSTVWDDPIWLLRGENGSASSLEVVDYRRWVGASYMLWDTLALNTLSASAPLGSTAQIINGDTYYLASRAGVLDWVNATSPDWLTVTLPSGFKAGTSIPQYRVKQGEVEFRGEVVKTTGSWAVPANEGSATFTAATMPTNLAPAVQRGNAACVTSLSTGGLAAVTTWVNASGQVRFLVPAGATVTSFYLDALRYSLEP